MKRRCGGDAAGYGYEALLPGSTRKFIVDVQLSAFPISCRRLARDGALHVLTAMSHCVCTTSTVSGSSCEHFSRWTRCQLASSLRLHLQLFFTLRTAFFVIFAFNLARAPLCLLFCVFLFWREVKVPAKAFLQDCSVHVVLGSNSVGRC